MPLQILSTLITQERHTNPKAKTATIQIVLADSAEADTASESLQVRTTVALSVDSYLPALQVAALEAAKEHINQTIAALRAAWKS